MIAFLIRSTSLSSQYLQAEQNKLNNLFSFVGIDTVRMHFGIHEKWISLHLVLFFAKIKTIF